ncbi:MAG TPA: SDR family NAD(P)-dependent oxidoreductase [Thermoanaerobaculia bacterium]|nr:SDR family NAD(P)-dependent oxidoreductase [Thermoanaerobaculia bacterium]
MRRLQDKIAVIVGASQGIGRAIALAFAAEGARVVVAARRRDALQRVVDQIAAEGGEAELIKADVTDEVSVSLLFDEVSRRHPRLDVLVNNAGIGSPRQLVADTPTAQLDHVIDINLRGTFYCCRAGFRLMRARGGGTIINVSSLAGTRAWAGAGAYCASKYGVVGLTRALAHEGRTCGIRVSALCPGGVAPPESDGPRREGYDELIEPGDVAQAAVFLAALGPKATIHQLVLDQLGGSDW